MIEAIIFDCFGVIITDALEILIEQLRVTHPERVREALDLVTARNHGMLDYGVYQSHLATLLDMPLSEYQSQLSEGEVKDSRILDYAAELRKDYKTALLTNVGLGGLMRRFTTVELERAFDAVVASGEIGYAKPEPQAYEITAERLGVRLSACVLIDDREEYCLGAQGVGMRAIQYVDFTKMKTELTVLLRGGGAAEASRSGRP
ncbi:MAG: HAD family hydrolase [Candidatus Micrarchaeaceae archaeon]